MRSKVETQLQTVASKFVGFKSQLKIDIQRYDEFVISPSWSSNDQVYSAHPAGTVLLVYSDTPGYTYGWIGDNFAIHVNWQFSPNAFDNLATAGLTHEFGHVFGGVDEYNLEVDVNPISGSIYRVDPNYMSDPYSFPVWDTWTIGLINKADGHISSQGSEVVSSLPNSFQVLAKTSTGAAVSGAHVKLYPVNWGSRAVTTTAKLEGNTSTDGSWMLPANPFGANTPGFPWNVQTPNFLVETRKGVAVSFSWLSLVDAGTFYFQHTGQAIMPLPVQVG